MSNGDSGARPRTDDSLARSHQPTRILGTSPGAVLVANFIKVINAVGDDAEADYTRALKELRGGSQEAMAAIAEASGSCAAEDYPLRWALVYAATQLRRSAALPFLRNLVLEPIPPERSSKPHSFSTVGQETVLRTTAVEGIGDLARKGSKRALDVLFECLSIPSISIRRAAVQSILAIDKGLRARVADCLPKDARFLLDIQRRDVREIPQVKDAARHLRKGANIDKPTPPRLEDDGPRSDEDGGKGPTLGG